MKHWHTHEKHTRGRICPCKRWFVWKQSCIASGWKNNCETTPTICCNWSNRKTTNTNRAVLKKTVNQKCNTARIWNTPWPIAFKNMFGRWENDIHEAHVGGTSALQLPKWCDLEHRFHSKKYGLGSLWKLYLVYDHLCLIILFLWWFDKVFF